MVASNRTKNQTIECHTSGTFAFSMFYDFLIAITAIIAWETGSKFDPLSPIPQQHTLKGASHQRKKRANNMFGLHASVHSVCPVSRKTWNRTTLNVMSLLLKLMTFKRPQKKDK